MIRVLWQMRHLGKAAVNRELQKIYKEVKPIFSDFLEKRYRTLTQEDIDELLDDSILTFYQQASSGKLTELTCSVTTYICRIGRNKAVDRLRSEYHGRSVEIPIDNFYSLADDFWNDDDDKNAKLVIVENVVRWIKEPCRKILKLFYFQQASMKTIAIEMGYANTDVAKTTKNKCLNKARVFAKEKLNSMES
ncbi:MAG: sigma-70 family RNA polymerase sigma factor [Prevotella sp.]|nr:sigma-70 family RNA polymerase sigma factor [Prevotella sp.]MBQ6209594.1 sigma-70 family RNA polymerase sigma factor [Prevotella sp.]